MRESKKEITFSSITSSTKYRDEAVSPYEAELKNTTMESSLASKENRVSIVAHTKELVIVSDSSSRQRDHMRKINENLERALG